MKYAERKRQNRANPEADRGHQPVKGELMAVLVLLRHGESAWNAADVFTGWIDVGLSERGEQQARRAGELLAARGFLPDVVHTSVQRRAIRSADLALAACARRWASRTMIRATLSCLRTRGRAGSRCTR
jgi:hypothetical protein